MTHQRMILTSVQKPTIQRRLIVERLECRQLLSATDVFVMVDQAELSMPLDEPELATTCRLTPINALSPLTGHFASQGVDRIETAIGVPIPGEQVDGGPADSGLTSPLNQALSSSNPTTVVPEPSDDLPHRDYFDEDMPEGENPLDASAPPLVDVPDSAGDSLGSQIEFSPIPSIQQAIQPLGIYLDSLADQSFANSNPTETNTPIDNDNGGFVDLSLLHRSDFESGGSFRDSWIESLNLGEGATAYDDDEHGGSDDILIDLELDELSGWSEHEDSILGNDSVAKIDDEFDGERETNAVLSESEHVAFLNQFGGLIVDADGNSVNEEFADATPAVADAPQERSRDRYHVVDVILGNAQAFDVMFDQAAIHQNDSNDSGQLFDATSLEAATPSDASTSEVPLLNTSSGEMAPTAAEASLTGSASLLFLMSNRGKKRRPLNRTLVAEGLLARREFADSAYD